MRFYFFHLMPYQDLPADFTEKHHSVWIDTPTSLYDPVKGHGMYNEYIDELEYAAKVGFDGIGVNEHHQNAYGMMPSPNLIAATLARSTTDTAIIVLGNSLALYNPPLRVAEEFAMLDVISGGRLVAGFPVGTSMDTNYAYGQAPATLREKYYEAHNLVVRAWTEPEPFVFNGKFTQLHYVNLWPRPIQKPHPPVWIPGGGSIETYDWVAQNEYCYSNTSYSGFKRGESVMNGYWEVNDKYGLDHNPYRGAFLQLVCVGATDREAEELYTQHVQYFFDKCLHIGAKFSEAPGYRTIKTLEAGLSSQFRGPLKNARKDLAWKDYIENGYIIGGSPATVRDALKDAIEKLHVGHMLLLLNIGDMTREKTMYNTRLFAEEVMPHLQGMWGEWEDKWYPKALAEKDRRYPEVLAGSK